MTALTLAPPAKVNLYLAVHERQPDGYHRLTTLFERLELADTLVLRRQPSGITLTCDDPAVPTDGRNLVVRAAASWAEASGIRGGVAAHLEKRIPVAGGLGGGSSDAASTLLGLNTLYDQSLTQGQLVTLGRQLGADVPFFLSEAVLAWGRGRGDEIEPLAPPSRPLWHVLVNPGEPLLTKTVYETFDRLPLTPPLPDATLLLRLVQTGEAARVAPALANALEPAIESNYPAIRHVQHALTTAGALGVIVSGSGPTTFGLAADEAQARAIAVRLQQQQPAWRVLVTRTALVSRSTAAPVRGDA